MQKRHIKKRFLSKIKKLRTNENILIAIDVLCNGRASFMDIFLLSFMISASLRNSPVGFISYELVHYTLCGILSIILAGLLRKHPVGAWRASMLFSLAKIVAAITLPPNAIYFPFVLGLLTATESQLYWRPKTFLEISEVSNDRRGRFTSIRLIFIEIIKIVMPVILGSVISNTSYQRAAFIVIAISAAQFLLALLMRPTHKIMTESTHTLRESYRHAIKKPQLRQIFWAQMLRGISMSAAGLYIITKLNVYWNSDSDLELGAFYSIGSCVSILLILFYQWLGRYSRNGREALVIGLLPAVVLLPILSWLIPGNFLLAITLYVFYNAALGTLFSSTIFTVYYQGRLNAELHDSSYRIGAEIVGEAFLTLGRILSIAPVLLIFLCGRQELAMPLVILEAAFAPALMLIIHKSESSPASSKP